MRDDLTFDHVMMTKVGPCAVQRPAGCFISVPASLRVSADCVNLLEQMLKADPADRITLGRIREHPWFLTSLPIELQARLYDSGLGHGSGLDSAPKSVRQF